jgi:hypothetical protein
MVEQFLKALLLFTKSCLIISSVHCRPPLPIVLPASTGQGLQISAQLTRRDGQVFYSMLFENNTQVPLDGFMIQFNKNTFGLAAAGALQVIIIAYIGFYLNILIKIQF